MLLSGLLVISMTTMAATIYKWVDENGRVQYSDKQPTEGKTKPLTIDEQRLRSRSLEGQILDGEYRTWDGTIRIRLPHLVQPGAKIEARQINPMKSGLFMRDDFGHIYFVLITANSKLKLSIDDIIRNLQPQYEVLNRKVVNTDRGKELRLISFKKGGSPITSQIIEGGKQIEKQSLNLIDATTIFLVGKDNDIFEVTAGVTDLPLGDTHQRTTKEEKERLAKLAEEYLEEFLAGLVIK